MSRNTIIAAAAVMAGLFAGSAQAQTKYMMREMVSPKKVATKPTTSCGALIEGQWCTQQIGGAPAAAIVKTGPAGLTNAEAAVWCNANKDPYMIGVCMMQSYQQPMIVSNCRIGYVGSGMGYNASNCQ